MPQYKVNHDFMVETAHITVSFNIHSRWDYLGKKGDYVRLHRNGVFVDMPVDTFERNFNEVKVKK